jgi:hypothetical protein
MVKRYQPYQRHIQEDMREYIEAGMELKAEGEWVSFEDYERLCVALERILSDSCVAGHDAGHAGIERVVREALALAHQTEGK